METVGIAFELLSVSADGPLFCESDFHVQYDRPQWLGPKDGSQRILPHSEVEKLVIGLLGSRWPENAMSSAS